MAKTCRSGIAETECLHHWEAEGPRAFFHRLPQEPEGPLLLLLAGLFPAVPTLPARIHDRVLLTSLLSRTRPRTQGWFLFQGFAIRGRSPPLVGKYLPGRPAVRGRVAQAGPGRGPWWPPRFLLRRLEQVPDAVEGSVSSLVKFWITMPISFD